MLAALSEVITGNEKLTSHRGHSESGRTQSSRKLGEDRSVIYTTAVHNDSQHSVVESLSDVDAVLRRAQSQPARVRKLVVNDGLEHADTQVDREDASTGGLDA